MRFLKGHGTENDFVLLPDHDGALGSPSPDLVRALCDRHAGLGADGVIRVVRTTATDDPAAVAAREEAEWFMDYRNSDGSLSEMCGNGVRVLGRYLVTRAGASYDEPLAVATRGGTKLLRFEDGPDGPVTVDMGAPVVGGSTWVALGERRWEARTVSMGNPHAVAFLDAGETLDGLSAPGLPLSPPAYDEGAYPQGVNVELVVDRGESHVALRVHERGSGETRSCGTGACAVMVAAAVRDGRAPGDAPAYAVDVPGGRLEITWVRDADGERVLMTGPAVLVAEGNWLATR
ncbi:diaminopimelate epimerase [Nocardioides marmoribigeumensis]|uniref:Diaminopimelate epimerase n=1 Tax=Nocardioides marmoribigeumensis TaxID=433649 RepID=A0ABU2BPC2_9ACTN|nr:diaminopimelate epimerase [Nocardioides marmoribigeumensis]MDR7360487.1 diaminopimelate epimerase [Nocardioides marmoribigeumensis]